MLSLSALPRFRLCVPFDLSAGLLCDLDKDQTHYLENVMRAKPGEELAVFNGRDGEWLARIDSVGKRSCRIALLSQRRPQTPEPDIWLLFAPIKRARLDFIAEKATELGVSGLWPVFTRRTIVTRIKGERMHANAVEAAEQTERLTLPRIFDPMPLDKVLGTWPAERRLLYMDETGGGGSIARILPTLPPGPMAILVGPEGGFDKSELDALRNLPFSVAVGLGPRVLRADTAALAALACWQALCGDWEGRPAFRSDATHL